MLANFKIQLKEEVQNNLFYKLLASAAIILVIAFAISSSSIFLVWSILLILIHNVIFSLENLSDHVVFLFFNLIFAFFLYSRFFVTGVLGYTSGQSTSGAYGFSFADNNLIYHILFSISLSILTISFVYIYLYSKRKSRVENISNTTKGSSSVIDSIKNTIKNERFISIVRKVSATVFLVSIVVKFIYLISEINFVREVGYYQSYIIGRPDYIRYLNLIADMSYASYFIFLATKPKLKNTFIISALFLAASFLELLTGARNPFMLNLLIVLSYYILQSKRIKINRKFIITIVLLSLLALGLMIFIGSSRGSKSGFEEVENNTSLISSVLNFFYGQGVSASTIGYVRVFENWLPDKLYALGVPIDFIKLDVLGRIIPSIPSGFEGQSVELAMGSHQLLQALSYIVFPYEYLNQGLGIGSSYIAELDYLIGYIGNFLGSALYGLIIFKFSEWIKSDNFILVLLALFMCRDLFFTPRASYTYFLFNILTETQLLTIFIVLVISLLFYFINKKSKHK